MANSCALCGGEPQHPAATICDSCWELEIRIRRNPKLALKILKELPHKNAAMVMEEFEDCLLGVCLRFGQEPIAAYDYHKVIHKLEVSMGYDNAVEWFDFNIIGAWVGDRTPCFIDTELPLEDLYADDER